tara:strand:+ start:311 stop:511 length:201 start_codon:yes stop_codon:yes gene_type:complete
MEVKIGDMAKYKFTNGIGLVVDIKDKWRSDTLLRGVKSVFIYYTFYDPPQVIDFPIYDVEVIYEGR